jgi:hypothetical protein
MSTVIDVYTPDGKRHRHATSAQNGEVEVRALPNGGVEVVGVHATPEIRNGSLYRPGHRGEEVLGTYPAGSRVEYIAH